MSQHDNKYSSSDGLFDIGSEKSLRMKLESEKSLMLELERIGNAISKQNKKKLLLDNPGKFKCNLKEYNYIETELTRYVTTSNI